MAKRGFGGTKVDPRSQTCFDTRAKSGEIAGAASARRHHDVFVVATPEIAGATACVDATPEIASAAAMIMATRVEASVAIVLIAKGPSVNDEFTMQGVR